MAPTPAIASSRQPVNKVRIGGEPDRSPGRSDGDCSSEFRIPQWGQVDSSHERFRPQFRHGEIAIMPQLPLGCGGTRASRFSRVAGLLVPLRVSSRPVWSEPVAILRLWVGDQLNAGGAVAW